MKRRITAVFCLAALVLCLAACSEKEEATTTVTGIVVSVEGTLVTLREMTGMQEFGANGANGDRGNGQGQRPSGFEENRRPEGDFTMPEGDFTMPEGDFTVPEGMDMPSRPNGDFDPNNFSGELPEGMTMPTMPADGEMPNFFGDTNSDAATTTVDLKNAHISVQDGDIKAAGSMSDIKAGSFLTITCNSSGEATEVLVSTMDFGGRGQGGFSGTGFGGGRGNWGKQAEGSIEKTM